MRVNGRSASPRSDLSVASRDRRQRSGRAGERTIVRGFCLVVMIAGIASAGCSSAIGEAPGLSESSSRAREECVRTGGAWREVLTFCEYR
jgi:hypothetical protein